MTITFHFSTLFHAVATYSVQHMSSVYCMNQGVTLLTVLSNGNQRAQEGVAPSRPSESGTLHFANNEFFGCAYSKKCGENIFR